jgi:molecular chaperone DnaK
MGANVEGSLRMEIDDAVANLKRALKGDDAAAIRQASEVLTRVTHKLAESMYQQPGASPEGNSQPKQGGGRGQASSKAPEEDVVDAEYQEVG